MHAYTHTYTSIEYVQLTSFLDFVLRLQLGFNDYLDLLSFDVRGAEGALKQLLRFFGG